MTTDVLICGGGPAGAAAALTLSRTGIDILLAHQPPPARVWVGEALPPAAKPLLAELRLLPDMEDAGHLVCTGNVFVWGQPHPVIHDFMRDPNGMGWHLDRPRFDASIRAAATAQGATVWANSRVLTLTDQDERWQVRVRRPDGTETNVYARWVMDATGRSSGIARRLGAERQREDRLLAFIARFVPAGNTKPDRDARTWIEAVHGGWWYTALLPSQERVVVFHTDADLADRDQLRTPEGFATQLAEATHLNALLADFGYHIHERPHGVDASSGCLRTAVGARWLAVGDAALSFDPLSSQGLFNALYTGLRSGEALAAYLTGDPTRLPQYHQRIRSIYRRYLAHRDHFYAAERRWVAAPFWARRINASVPSPL